MISGVGAVKAHGEVVGSNASSIAQKNTQILKLEIKEIKNEKV